MTRAGALIVSVFPRGQPGGGSALVAIDADSLELLAYREVPAGELLADERTGRPSALRHCRGLAVHGDRLFAAVFNAVAEYRVIDPRSLDLELVRRWTSPAAMDLHGLTIVDGQLFAVSTGGRCLLSWDLVDGRSTALVLDGGAPCDRDLRFPDRRVPHGAACPVRWRPAISHRDHLNDVAWVDAGALVVCSLGALRVSDPRRRRLEVVLEQPGARLHDVSRLSARELLLTDGATGELVWVDACTWTTRRRRVVDPRAWFLRGLHVSDSAVYALQSQITRNGQAVLPARPEGAGASGATFGISKMAVADGEVLATRAIHLPRAATGAVAYTACASKPRQI